MRCLKLILVCFILPSVILVLSGQSHGDFLTAKDLYKDKKYVACKSSIQAILKTPENYEDSTLAATHKLQGDLFLKEFDLKKTLAQYELSDAIYEKYGNKHFHERLILANKSGICYAQQDNLILTAKYFQKEYDIAIQNYKADDLTVGKSTNNLAAVYLYLGDYDKSLKYFFKSEKIKKKFEDENPIALANTYENISTIYGQINHMGEAERYLRKAGHLYERDSAAGIEALFPFYINMATFYIEVDKIEDGIEQLDRGTNLPEEFKANKLGVLIQQKLYGDAYFKNEEFDKALDYYQKAERLIKKYEVGQKELGVMHTQMADIYVEKGNRDLAIRSLDLARSEMLPLYGATHRNYLNLLQNQISILLKMDELVLAEKLVLDFKKNLNLRNESLSKDLLFSNLKMGLLTAELNYSLVAFTNTNKKEGLAQAILKADEVVQYQDEVLKSISDKDSKLYFFRNAYANISAAIFLNLKKYEQTNHELFLDKAFLLSEKAKYYSIHEAKGLRLPNYDTDIPKELIDKEMKSKIALNQKISKYETQLDTKSDPVMMLDLINEIDSLKKEHQAAVNELAKESQVIDRHLKNEDKLDIKIVKRKLNEIDRVYVSYFLNSNEFVGENYAFVINNNDLSYKTLLLESVENEIATLIKSLKLDFSSPDIEKDLNNFQGPSVALYSMLLTPLDLSLDKGIIFNLDKELYSIPFEVLINENEFLIAQTSVAYVNSVQSIIEASIINYDKNLLSAAPSFNATAKLGLMPLENSKLEIEKIESLIGFKSDVRVNSKSEFQKEVQTNKYNIVHLATHASADQNQGYQSYLAFGNGEQDLLYSREIYGLPIYANMVVLSACESGDGELAENQGVLGLTSAFAATAAQSVVASLWNVNDAASHQIMEGFYQELKSGELKDEALRKSKLSYLSSVPKSKRHPFYWAGFIQYGAIDPLKFESSSILSTINLGVWLAFFFAIVFIGAFIWKKKKAAPLI